jgi:hypothetical protein
VSGDEISETQTSHPSDSHNFGGERLFIAIWCTGISYYDKAQIEDGQYKRVAFLDYHTLTLEWHGAVSPTLAGEITADAATIQAKRAQSFQFGGPGQTIILGE